MLSLDYIHIISYLVEFVKPFFEFFYFFIWLGRLFPPPDINYYIIVKSVCQEFFQTFLKFFVGGSVTIPPTDNKIIAHPRAKIKW